MTTPRLPDERVAEIEKRRIDPDIAYLLERLASLQSWADGARVDLAEMEATEAERDNLAKLNTGLAQAVDGAEARAAGLQAELGDLLRRGWPHRVKTAEARADAAEARVRELEGALEKIVAWGQRDKIQFDAKTAGQIAAAALKEEPEFGVKVPEWWWHAKVEPVDDAAALTQEEP
jgi:hypothetical protein